MIHISRSVVGAAELEAMGRVMREDGYLGMGREVRAFEEELQEYLGGRRTARSSASIPAPRPCIWRCRRSPAPGMKSWSNR